MNELFSKSISRIGFIVAWAYIETVYLAFTILLGNIPLWFNVSPLIMKGVFWFFYMLRFVLLLGIIVRRLRTTYLPEILSWLVVFPPIQIILSFFLCVFPGKHEAWIPHFKREIKEFHIETVLFGGYGE